MNSRFFLFCAFIVIGLFSGCVKDKFDAPDSAGCIDAGLTPTTSIAQLKALFNGTAVQITDDLIIEGTVISSDQEGNFYKSLVIQDATAGILLLIDQTNMYTNYPIGRKIYVKVKNLYLDDYAGLIQLGASLNAQDGSLERIPQSLVDEYIFKGACNVAIDTLRLSPGELDVDLHQNRLIQLTNMTMDNNDAGGTYATPGGNSALNRTLLDCNGGSVILRTSDFARFAGNTTPTERFNITGIFGVFNSDKQFTINSDKDVVVTGVDCPCEEVAGNVSGTTTFYLDDVTVLDADQNALVGEDFESVSYNQPVSITDWVNVTTTGSEQWEGGDFPSSEANKYARVSAYNTGNTNVVAWLISPEFTIAGNGETLSLRTKGLFADQSAVLEVLISTDYNGDNTPQDATWQKICPTLALPVSSSSSDWTESGLFDISGYTGNVHLAFRYKGGDN